MVTRTELIPETDKDATRFAAPRQLSKRVGELLICAMCRDDQPVQACLDDLLGAVYSLFYAVHFGFDSRPMPLEPDNMQSVLDRANDMANCEVRTAGKWAAGFYLNNALFRIDAVYHRAIETVTGKSDEKFPKLLACAEERFKKWRGSDWQSSKLREINCEVIRLKHRKSGLIAGRKVDLEGALEAVCELLVLLEAFTSAAPSSPLS
jgi:hypothetical protein